MKEKNFYIKLFFSLYKEKSIRLSSQGFAIDLSKKPEDSWVSFSSLLFQKDFLPPSLCHWALSTQLKGSLSPYLFVDDASLAVFLVQKVPLFLPYQLENLLPRFLSLAKRWSAQIYEICN